MIIFDPLPTSVEEVLKRLVERDELQKLKLEQELDDLMRLYGVERPFHDDTVARACKLVMNGLNQFVRLTKDPDVYLDVDWPRYIGPLFSYPTDKHFYQVVTDDPVTDPEDWIECRMANGEVVPLECVRDDLTYKADVIDCILSVGDIIKLGIQLSRSCSVVTQRCWVEVEAAFIHAWHSDSLNPMHKQILDVFIEKFVAAMLALSEDYKAKSLAKGPVDKVTQIQPPDRSMKDKKRFLREFAEFLLKDESENLGLHDLKEANIWIFDHCSDDAAPYPVERKIYGSIRNGGEKVKDCATMYDYIRQGKAGSASVKGIKAKAHKKANRKRNAKELHEIGLESANAVHVSFSDG